MRLLWSQGAELTFREGEFFGREEELSVLLRVALEGRAGAGSSVLVFGPPNVGKTSLLLKLKAALLSLPGGDPPRPFPFYYPFSKILSHPLALSQHFLQEYLWQLLSFLGNEPPAPFDTDALCEALRDRGLPACGDVAAAHRRYTGASDGLSALANALSLPFAAAGEGFYNVLLFDDFQYTLRLQGVPDGAIFSVLRPYIKSGRYPLVVSGSSPGHVSASLKREGLYGSFQLMEVGGISREASRRMWSSLVERRPVGLPEDLLERASERLGRIPIYQRMFAQDLAFRNERAPDAVAFENLYARAVTEGLLNRYWREFFENAFPERGTRARAVRFLKRVLCDRFPIDSYEGALALLGPPPEEGSEILTVLEFKGLLKSDLEQLRFVGDPVLVDFLRWAFERGVIGRSSSQVAAAIVQSKLSGADVEAPWGERERTAETVKVLMRRWDGREVPSVLFDYPRFRDRYGGRGLLEVVIGIGDDPERIALPRISSVAAGHRTRRAGARLDLDLVAYGFEGGDISEENLVAWAVDVHGEKPVTLPAVEHFENRCRLLAYELGLPAERLRRWIVFGGTLDPSAAELAVRLGIRVSHRTQLRLLLNLFGVEEIEAPPAPAGPPGPLPPEGPIEFELVLPAKADTEGVAARVAEEVAVHAALPKDDVDRVKMAIIEACLDAFQRRGAGPGKVRLRYLLAGDRIEVVVRHDGPAAPAGEEERERRGFGLKLIRELVDEAGIESGPEGTTLRMVKRIGRKGDPREDAPPADPGA